MALFQEKLKTSQILNIAFFTKFTIFQIFLGPGLVLKSHAKTKIFFLKNWLFQHVTTQGDRVFHKLSNDVYIIPEFEF